MKKILIFSRVSTIGQDLTQQTQAIENEAFKLGYSKEQQVLVEFKESAIKLGLEDRRGIAQLKESINNDPDIDCVICWELSRIARRADVIYNIRDFLLERKIQLVIMTPYMRLLDEKGKMSQTASIMLALFTSLAESEMDIKKERMLRARRHNVANGKSGGGRPPFGYTTDKDNFYIIDEYNASIIRRIFNDYSTGMLSMRKICKNLKAEGYFPNTKFFTLMNDVNRWMKTELYCGNDTYPAIITKELFDKCQESTKHNTIVRHGHPNTSHLLKGLIYDKQYGLLLSISKANQNYYSRKCPGANIAVKNIDYFIWELASDLYYNKLNEKDHILDELNDRMQVILKKMKVSEANHDAVQDKIDKLEERIVYGKISEEKANAILHNLEEERKKYKIENTEYIAESVDIQKKIMEVMFGSKTVQGMETFEDKIEIINKVIKRITIFKPKRTTAVVTVYNKVDNIVRTYEVKCWKQEHRLIHTTESN